MVVGRKIQMVVDLDVADDDTRTVPELVEAVQEAIDNGAFTDDIHAEVVLAEVNN